MEEREAWLALNMVPHVGPATFAILLEHFGTAKRILKASLKALAAVPGVGPATAKAIRDSRVQETVARERKRMAGRDLRFVTLREEGYPAPLRDIHRLSVRPRIILWENRESRETCWSCHPGYFEFATSSRERLSGSTMLTALSPSKGRTISNF